MSVSVHTRNGYNANLLYEATVCYELLRCSECCVVLVGTHRVVVTGAVGCCVPWSSWPGLCCSENVPLTIHSVVRTG